MREGVGAPTLSRRTVTVLFADMVGSTPLAEQLDPEAMREVLERYFDAMNTIIQRHGGTTDKFIGDAVVAVFGLPEIHEDDALRAVRAAWEMQQALADLNHDLAPRLGVGLMQRVGINTGEIVAGDLSTHQRLVSGDAMNVAARLQQTADPGAIILSQGSFQLVKRFVTAEPLERLMLKGKSNVVQAYRVIAVTALSDAAAYQFTTPLIGRDADVESLEAALEQAIAEQRPHLVTILGAAGVGKSRLLAEFLARTRGRTVQLRSRCLAYGEGITFWPLAQIVRQCAGIRANHTEREARRRLLDLTAEQNVADRLGSIIGLPGSYPVEEIFWATGRLVDKLADRGLLVIALDDIHWAEPTLLDLIEYITDRSVTKPVLLIAASRPDLIERRDLTANRENSLQIQLEALSEADGANLLREIGGDQLPSEMIAGIMRAGEGNPLFIEQLYFMFADDQHDGQALDLRIPPTLSALLSARLDRLSASERAVAEAGSVYGYLFDGRAISYLCGENVEEATEQTLASLVKKQFLEMRPAQDAADIGFRFRHVLIRDAAYDGTLKRRRAALHERCAGWLQQAGGDAPDSETLTGFHLERAFLYKRELGSPSQEISELGYRAAGHLKRAGLAAEERGDASAAANLLRRSEQLYPRHEPGRLEVLTHLGAALRDRGERDAAKAAFTEALEASHDLSDVRAGWHARFGLLALEPDLWTDATTLEVQDMIPLLQSLDDDLGVAKCFRYLTLVHWVKGELVAADETLWHAVEYAQRAGDRNEEIEIVAGLALSTVTGPKSVADGLRILEELFQRVRGNHRAEGFVLFYMAELSAIGGAFDRARELIDRGQAVLEEAGVKVWAADEAWRRGFIEATSGNMEEAERQLLRGLNVGESSKQNYQVVLISCYLARVLCSQGRYEEALERLELLSKNSMTEIDVDTLVISRGARARVIARLGDALEAERLALEAVSKAASTDNVALHADALMDLADVLEALGRFDKAMAAAQHAVELYQAKGFVPAAEWATSTIARLSVLTAGTVPD